jgi:hypothetical protein
MLQCLYTYIASMCCKCFIYFECPYTYIASMCCKYFIYFGCMLQQMLLCCKCFMSRRGKGA